MAMPSSGRSRIGSPPASDQPSKGWVHNNAAPFSPAPLKYLDSVRSSRGNTARTNGVGEIPIAGNGETGTGRC